MTAPTILKGPRIEPDRIFLYGIEGVGKSSFAAGAPNNLFLDADKGLANLNVESVDGKVKWPAFLDILKWFETEDHPYKTLTIDTVDAVEALIHADLCDRNKWANMEALDYAKCYAPAVDEFRRLLAALERIQATRGTEIILLAHSQIKTFQNPAGADYSRYEPLIEKRALAVIKGWVRTLMFANFEEIVMKGKKEATLGDKGKAIITGARIMHTERRSGWDSKNRWNLPATLPLSYADYAKARSARQVAPPADLYAEAVALIARMPEASQAAAKEYIEKNKTDSGVLAEAVNRLRVIADQNQKEE